MPPSDDRILLAALLIGISATACRAPSTPAQLTGASTPAVATPTITITPTITPVVTPIPLPIEYVLSDAMPLTGQPLDYSGIVPGKSTRADVISRRGPPNVTRRYRDYESLHYFTNGQEYFLLQDGIVQAITSSKMGGYGVFEDLEKKFPSATRLTPDFGAPTWALPTQGLAFSLYTYQFLKPMTLAEYTALWNHYPLGVDPFPLIPSVETVGVMPGKTTRSELESRLGTPDIQVAQDQNAPWIYDVEPDLLGRLDVFFNGRDVVRNMSITASMRMPRYTLEDAVNQYGEPDWVQLIPGWEAGGEGTQALLYLPRGLRVGAACYPPACSVVDRSSPVVQKWYFQPTTLDEYRKDFGHSQFVPWHGFSIP